MYTPVNPSFYYVKEGFKGGQNYIGMFSWWKKKKKKKTHSNKELLKLFMIQNVNKVFAIRITRLRLAPVSSD